MPGMNSNTDKFVIKTPAYADRPAELEGWLKLFTPAECCEIFNRYCDEKDRAAKYRRQAAAKAKAVRAYLAANPEVAAEIEAEVDEAEG